MSTPENEKDDPVWDLLNKAPTAKPGPFFSRNVVREVRMLDSAVSGSLGARGWRAMTRFFQSPGGAWATVSAVAMVAILLIVSRPPATEQMAVSTETPVTAVDAESAGTVYDPANEIGNLDYLGELMAVTDPSLLDDNALADLLF